MIILHDVEQGSPEWHALHDDVYTGSNAEKLLKFGTIPYSRRWQSDFGGNFYTERGHTLETEALELYAQIYEHPVQRPGFVTNTAYRRCGYSPDGIDSAEIEISEGVTVLLGGVLLEVKAFTKDKHRAIAKGEIPLKIESQIQFGMVITGLRKARLILYNPDFAKKEIDGQPNPDYDVDLALVIIDVRYNRNAHSNIKRILKEGKYAVHTQTANA